MKVSDVMTTEVATAKLDERLSDCAKTMDKLNIGILPVIDDFNRLVGVITDRDIAVRAVAKGKDINHATCQEFMTPSPVTVQADMDVEAAADLMADKQVRRLPVIQDERLIGIVSLGDLAVDIGETELMGETLEKISVPVR